MCLLQPETTGHDRLTIQSIYNSHHTLSTITPRQQLQLAPRHRSEASKEHPHHITLSLCKLMSYLDLHRVVRPVPPGYYLSIQLPLYPLSP
jgi:hypothetical protein